MALELRDLYRLPGRGNRGSLGEVGLWEYYQQLDSHRHWDYYPRQGTYPLAFKMANEIDPLHEMKADATVAV